MYKKIDEFINVGDIKPELKVYNLNDFCELKVPPREHILSPWLYTQSMAMIHAPRGIGKTHMGLSIAYAAATAGEFLKWKAPKERNVIYVDGEMPTSLLQERLKLLNKNELNVTNLKIIASGQQYFGIPDLSRKEEQINFDKYIDPDTDLIIFDNISTLFRTGKENESESWTNAQSWTLSLRARGITVIFIWTSQSLLDT